MPLTDQKVKSRLKSVSAGLLTPFDAEGKIRHDDLRSNIRSLYQQGIRSFLAVANISEYHSLSQEERIALAETSVEEIPSDAAVLAGVGGSTGDATELIRAYDRIGVDAMMIMPPDHSYIHERGLLQYYSELSKATDRPLVPYVKGFDPSVEYLADLTRVDGVIGIKYAIANPSKLGSAAERGADDVVWVDGLAEPFAVAAWAEGAEGFSAGVSNFRPEVGLALYDALKNGNWERARRLRNICLPFQRLRERTGANNTISAAASIPTVKKGLELSGLHGGHVREPLESLSETDERRVEEVYQQLDEDIERLVEQPTTH
ncbi:dihydrodipicolinate synthase family protein [Halobellus sp. EA9]|uniref:dihydrodipicolinate synthase family protein n=1 Tax=Halobellus sp. EA9 TaxID=3421647 RepID=UPI003EC00DB3